MNRKGFFSIIAALLFLTIATSVSNTELKAGTKAAQTGREVLSIRKSAFERTEAELFIDKKIERSIGNTAPEKIVAEEINRKTASQIMAGFRELNLDAKSCAKNGNTIIETSPLNEEKIALLTRTTAIKTGPVVEIIYSITGGLSAEFPCAEIPNGNYSLFFALPIGYTRTFTVLE